MNVAVIPARGGSKRITRKNIKEFCGKPIIAWPIEVAKQSKLFEHILVSTDDREIAEVSKSCGGELPFMRPEEFSDDYVRSKTSNLSYDEAWEKIKPLTDFGKLLHEKNIQITIPFDIDLLGIKNGTYDLQRFIYDYFFKCFWNESWGYEYSNLVNVDWYHPKYCWRHSEDEIRSWCSEFNLSIRYIKELESGYACHVVKTSSII